MHALMFSADPPRSEGSGSAPETQTFDADGLPALLALIVGACNGPEESEARLRFFADSTTDSSTSRRFLLGDVAPFTFPLRSFNPATAGNKLILAGAERLERGTRGEGGSGKASIRSTVLIVLVGYENLR